MRSRSIILIAALVLATGLLVSFQNCQKKQTTVTEDDSSGATTGGTTASGGDVGGSDEGPGDNPVCPAGATRAACTPAGGGTTTGNLNVWGFTERVYLFSEGRPIHAAMHTQSPILGGWVVDTDFNGATKKSLSVNIYFNGTFCNSVVANIPRGDLRTLTFYPGDPPNYGWGLIIEGLPAGNYMVNAFGVDPNSCTEVPLTGNGYQFTVQ